MADHSNEIQFYDFWIEFQFVAFVFDLQQLAKCDQFYCHVIAAGESEIFTFDG